MSTGARIAQLRISFQWSQSYLARKAGVNLKSVQDWENEVSLPSMATIKKLCNIFHTTSDYLLELDSRPVIVLDKLPAEEVERARKILQVLIDTTPHNAENR